MRAFVLDDFDTQPALRNDLPEPEVGDEEVLVRVVASSVNPVDLFIASGALREYAEYEFPVTLGRDFAGVVERVGAAVAAYNVGDEVFGFVRHASPSVRRGAWAELVAVPTDNELARKPASVDVAEAGAVALAGLTAVAAVDALDVREGRTVLVVGAAGGVGSLFVQLAASAGAHVIAPALPEEEWFLTGLGVTKVIPRDGDVAAAVRDEYPEGVDAILDVVSQEPDASLLKGGGRLASTLGVAGDEPGRANLMSDPTPANLQRLASFLEQGTMRVLVDESYRLERADEALAALPTTHTRGKIGVTIPTA
jgi:NADPH:quinone reductase